MPQSLEPLGWVSAAPSTGPAPENKAEQSPEDFKQDLNERLGTEGSFQIQKLSFKITELDDFLGPLPGHGSRNK